MSLHNINQFFMIFGKTRFTENDLNYYLNHANPLIKLIDKLDTPIDEFIEDIKTNQIPQWDMFNLIKPYTGLCFQRLVIKGDKNLLMISKTDILLFNIETDADGYHDVLVVDRLGAVEMTKTFSQLQRNCYKDRPIEKRLEVLYTTNPNWFMNEKLIEYKSEGGAKIVLKDILRLSTRDFHKLIDPLMIKTFNNYEEIMNHKSEKDVPSELREGFQFWLDKEEKNAVKSFVARISSSLQTTILSINQTEN